MSLYYDGAQILSATHEQSGSLKSRVFAAKDLKSTPAQLFALVSETSKWSFILKEVVEKSKILVLERKVNSSATYNIENILTDEARFDVLALSCSRSSPCPRPATC